MDIWNATHNSTKSFDMTWYSIKLWTIHQNMNNFIILNFRSSCFFQNLEWVTTYQQGNGLGFRVMIINDYQVSRIIMLSQK
jgi:hypothetical protein